MKKATDKSTKGTPAPPLTETSGSPPTETTEVPGTSEARGRDSLIFAGKKFDFYGHRTSGPASPDAEASFAGGAISPSYEEIREKTPHSGVREVWLEADRRTEDSRQALADIDADESLSVEGKRERAQRVVEKNAQQIEEGYADARKKTQVSAESSWRFSIPMPDEKTLATTSVDDSSELLAVQNEANALATRITGSSLQQATRERSRNPRDKGVQPTASHAMDALRDEFSLAMETGGVVGKIKALAISKLCEEMGFDLNNVVDAHRKNLHRRAYQDAEALESATYAIPTGRGVVTNPWDSKAGSRRGSKAVGAYGSSNKAVASTGGREKLFAKKRRPSWK